MSKLVLHHGELVSERRLWLRAWMLIAGALVWLLVFLLIPSLLLLALGFARRDPDGGIVWSFTIENYRRMLGFDGETWNADYLRILLRSLWVAAVTTGGSVLLAYPLAFFIASRPAKWRYPWLALVVVPLCTNLVIRTYAWMLLLGQEMPPARLALWLGWIPPETALHPGSFAVYLGMIGAFLPFAALPVYASVERIDPSIVDAARDLYASGSRVFVHAILPQTLPGLWTGVILTFVPTLGVFIVPDLLGGSRHMLAGNLIQQQFGVSRDWPFGAAVSFGLMALTLVGLYVFRRWGDREETMR